MSNAYAAPSLDAPLVQVSGLTKYYPLRRKTFAFSPRTFVKAVDGIDFSVAEGTTLGLVGESGCGKSTTGRLLLRLIEPTGGSVRYAGMDLLKLRPRELKHLRREIQIVFQDPFGSLNPRMTVEEIIAEPLVVHGANHVDRAARVLELLDLVGLARDYAGRYPHEFSGGQRQRISIARALSLRPRFLVCDEAVSALDVSVQAQILNLLRDLQTELNLTYLFISHNLGVVRHIAQRVAVMYLGKIVEIGETAAIFTAPRHPYTQALLSSIPVPDPSHSPPRIRLPVDPADASGPVSGCPFRTRCPHSIMACAESEPTLLSIGPDHHVACHCVKAPAQ